MTDSNKSDLIANFMSITGSDEERAIFCLSAAQWELPMAMDLYYQGAEDGGGSSNQASASAPNPAPNTAANPAEKKAASGGGSSRFATIGSMRSEESDDDSGEEGQAFYAGGSEHGGGQQVLGPRRKKDTDRFISDMFSAAKEHGAEEVAAGSSSGASERGGARTFHGSGYRLGEAAEDSSLVPGTAPAPKPKQVDMVLKLWKNGFSVDDGELRNFSDPQNRQFLEAIKKGEVPQELIRLAKGGEVSLNMEDHREQEFTPSKRVTKAFSGEGQRLGSVNPAVVASSAVSSSPAASASNEESARSSVSLDLTAPVTQIQIRLADGSRMVAKFNHTHKVSDIRQYIVTARPQYAGSSFVLMTTFPNREISGEESASLVDAQLINAVIVQRLK